MEKQVSPLFNNAGIPVLGEIPEDRALLTITIGEVAAAIQGEILNNAEKSPELVENIMLGAMSVDSGLEYFGRKGNKAVIVKNDRPDLQLAALETDPALYGWLTTRSWALVAEHRSREKKK